MKKMVMMKKRTIMMKKMVMKKKTVQTGKESNSNKKRIKDEETNKLPSKKQLVFRAQEGGKLLHQGLLAAAPPVLLGSNHLHELRQAWVLGKLGRHCQVWNRFKIQDSGFKITLLSHQRN